MFLIGNSTRQNKTEHPAERVTRHPFGACAFLLRIVHGVFDSLGIHLPRLVQSGGTETNTKAGVSAHAASIKSRSLPLSAFIKMLRETTGDDDVGVGTIRTTLFRHFGDDASPKIKKFVQVMAGNKLRQDGKLEGDEAGQVDTLNRALEQEEVHGDGSVKEVYAGTTASAPPLPLNGVLISGCQTDQTSGDATTAEGVSYGLLSNAVQTVLARKHDGTVTNRELVLKARELLSRQGVTTQQPGLYCSDEHASLPSYAEVGMQAVSPLHPYMLKCYFVKWRLQSFYMTVLFSLVCGGYDC
jgi:hypothetical protein